MMSRRGLTAKSLLWMMGETPEKTQKVYSWLSGGSVPSFEALVALHAALKCTWEELMGE